MALSWTKVKANPKLDQRLMLFMCWYNGLVARGAQVGVKIEPLTALEIKQIGI